MAVAREIGKSCFQDIEFTLQVLNKQNFYHFVPVQNQNENREKKKHSQNSPMNCIFLDSIDGFFF